MKSRFFLAMLVAALSCQACASYQPPSSLPGLPPPTLSSVHPVAKDHLLQALVDFAASSGVFSLDHVDSRSGTVLLRIRADSSEDFVDCGEFKRPWIPFKHHSFNGPYKNFLLFARQDGVIVVRLAVVLASISPKGTRVTVSANFELSSRQETTLIFTVGRTVTWDFDSDSPQTKYLQSPAWGSGRERTCRSTLEAELVALKTVGELADALARRN